MACVLYAKNANIFLPNFSCLAKAECLPMGEETFSAFIIVAMENIYTYLTQNLEASNSQISEKDELDMDIRPNGYANAKH